MHELLTLHYFATDSAAGWDDLMLKRLPGASLLKADARRQIALDMFEKSHITPSYRRLPHPSWTTCLRLLIDLLIGAGKTRYLGTRPHARHQREVFVRGFSAGSYSGMCLLHLLWKFPFVDARGKLGGIACPPALLSTIPADKGRGLELFHYERDLLAVGSRALTTSTVSPVHALLSPTIGQTYMITLARVSIHMDIGLSFPSKLDGFNCGNSCKSSQQQRAPSFGM